MEFPEKYILRGEKVLHSGGRTNIFYDVNALLTDGVYLEYILEKVPNEGHYIGIATGGALMAMALWRDRVDSSFSMIKDGELKGYSPSGEWLLIDDVVTTGSSLEEAIRIVGKTPSGIWVAVDRRERNENPRVNSIFEI